MKKETISINSCPTYYPLPNDPESNKAVINAPAELFKYIKINETTQTCAAKKDAKEREKCYQKFLDLDKKFIKK